MENNGSCSSFAMPKPVIPVIYGITANEDTEYCIHLVLCRQSF